MALFAVNTACRDGEICRLGYRAGRITTHYSAVELTKLIAAANRVCERKGKHPELVVLHRLSVS